jgi:hypothetical protein
MIHKGQWILLPTSLVMNDPNLRPSPLGVVPQRDIRPRTISNYAFFWVNEDTVAIAPGECKKFGRALWQILKHIKHANPHMGPVYMSKIEIADGFYRIWVRAVDVPKLGVLFPSRPGDDTLVGSPLTMTMGWKESPKIFTTPTETIADLANQQLVEGSVQPEHCLEAASEQKPLQAELPFSKPKVNLLGTAPLHQRLHTTCAHYHPPVGLWDIYVDDFLGLVQGNKHQRRQVKRALLHDIDSVMRPLDADDSIHWQEPASLKKMGKGDATWATVKTILGWILDNVDKTISLPAHRLLRLMELLDSVSTGQKRISLKKWQQLPGELCSMATVIPAPSVCSRN